MDNDNTKAVLALSVIILVFIGIIIASGIFLYNVDKKLDTIINKECSCKIKQLRE